MMDKVVENYLSTDIIATVALNGVAFAISPENDAECTANEVANTVTQIIDLGMMKSNVAEIMKGIAENLIDDINSLIKAAESKVDAMPTPLIKITKDMLSIHSLILAQIRSKYKKKSRESARKWNEEDI